jgi:hypothetical protein
MKICWLNEVFLNVEFQQYISGVFCCVLTNMLSIFSCEVIRDHKTGESLQYAFIEFEKVSDHNMTCS